MNTTEKSVDLRGRHVLVTGASGFLGSHLVSRLTNLGCNVRVLVRPTSNISELESDNIDIRTGDVTDRQSIEYACDGADAVVHAAADTAGTEIGGRTVTIDGTRNVLSACETTGIHTLLYISSCSVYGSNSANADGVVSEDSPLERSPKERGAYSWSKFEAERIVRQSMRKQRFRTVILRPGAIYGRGTEWITPMLGFRAGDRMLIVIGPREFVLPLVHVDNVVEAIVCAIGREKPSEEIYHVVDSPAVTKQEYVDKLVRQLYEDVIVLYLPYAVLSSIVLAQEKLLTMLGKTPFLTSYRLQASQARLSFDCTKLPSDLGYRQVTTFSDAVQSIVEDVKDRTVTG